LKQFIPSAEIRGHPSDYKGRYVKGFTEGPVSRRNRFISETIVHHDTGSSAVYHHWRRSRTKRKNMLHETSSRVPSDNYGASSACSALARSFHLTPLNPDDNTSSNFAPPTHIPSMRTNILTIKVLRRPATVPSKVPASGAKVGRQH